MRAAAVFAMCACASQATVSRPGNTSSVATAYGSAEPREGEWISGRAILDGRPVRRFGVIVTRHASLGGPTLPDPVPVDDPTGSFQIKTDRAGQWDVIISGPGFARRVIYGVDVERGKATSLGDVQLKPGFVIDGTVRDAAGAPVSGATVRIEQSPFRSDDVLRNLAEGNFSTTTGSNGYFRIPGVTIVDLSHGRMKVVASASDRFSREEWVDNGNHTIDLILQ